MMNRRRFFGVPFAVAAWFGLGGKSVEAYKENGISD
jgi:hypothetical protein